MDGVAERSPIGAEEASSQGVGLLQFGESSSSSSKPAVDKAEQDNVPAWDVSHGKHASGLFGYANMITPAIIHAATGSFGNSLALFGYSASKVGEKLLGAGKATDNWLCQRSFDAWLWSQGIFPKVEYDAWSDGLEQALLNFYGSTDSTCSPSMESIAWTPLLVSNHVSYLDGLIHAVVFRGPRIMCTESWSRTPIFGMLMKDMDVVFVDNGSEESRREAREAIVSHTSSWTLGQKPMLIFPEGTTTNGESVIDFKRGPFRPGMPVRPILITYTGNWDPASTTYRETASGRSEFTDKQWFANFFGHLVHSLHIRVLPPYIPDEEERVDADLFAKNCNAHMAAELKRMRQELRKAEIDPEADGC